jgi:hypothetical protein
MISKRSMSMLAIVLAAAASARLMAQVETDVPPVVPGARPVSVEHIKIHGAALEGNLEGDAIDRDAVVFLPPTSVRMAGVAIPWCTPCTDTRSVPGNGRTRST